MDYIDLRSDTVTKPTPEMREAMYRAEVGDDVFGDDPTVNRLQELAAGMTGHEDALLVASGTMGNLVGILSHCGRSDEAILGARSHSVLYEGGGVSSLGGVHSRQVMEQPDGSLPLADLDDFVRTDDEHFPVSRLIGIENTHNRCGGTYQSSEYVRSLVDFAHARGLVVHMDGARVFNAAAALGVDVKELTAPVDSVTFCLSKGLCAPVGSVLCGSREFIHAARRMRKHVGGGMRQAGIIAAAGIVALEKMTGRLGEDHLRARNLAEGLSEIPGIRIDPGSPATNMIYFDLGDGATLTGSQLEVAMKERGVLIHSVDEGRVRVVTHYWIDDAAAWRAVEAFREVLAAS
jgi:threonine aldolase